MRIRQTTQFCQGVDKAISDEGAAIRFYRQLASQAPTAATRRLIRRIRRDEISHRTLFRGIRARHCK